MYEDGYVRLKTTQYKEIEKFGFSAELNIGGMGTKTWGMGMSMIWWALGPIRKFNPGEHLIFQIKNTKIKGGFDSDNPNRVLSILGEKVEQ